MLGVMSSKTTMKYHIHYYKTENLTSDELRLMRKNQRGIWLQTGIFTTDKAAGLREAREWFRGAKYRAVRHS